MKNNKKMTRKTKAEKRRLAFEKRNVKKEQNLAHYGAEGGSALVMAKTTEFNRRVIAAVLALVFVLTTIVVGYNFAAKADDPDDGFKMFESIDDSGFVTRKGLRYNNNTGKYDLRMEAYATAPIATKAIDTKTTPLDVVMVLNQSDSMSTRDVFTSDYHKLNAPSYTIEDAEGLYFFDSTDNKYYPVQVDTSIENTHLEIQGYGTSSNPWTAVKANQWYTDNGNRDIYYYNSETQEYETVYTTRANWYKHAGNNVALSNFFNTSGIGADDWGTEYDNSKIGNYYYNSAGDIASHEPSWHKVHEITQGILLGGYYIYLWYYTGVEDASTVTDQSTFDSALTNERVAFVPGYYTGSENSLLNNKKYHLWDNSWNQKRGTGIWPITFRSDPSEDYKGGLLYTRVTVDPSDTSVPLNTIYTSKNHTLAWPLTGGTKATSVQSSNYEGTLYSSGYRLYYVKDGETEPTYISDSVFNSTDTAYTVSETKPQLYTHYTTRLDAMQQAASQLAESIATQATADNVDHRIGVVGYNATGSILTSPGLVIANDNDTSDEGTVNDVVDAAINDLTATETRNLAAGLSSAATIFHDNSYEDGWDGKRIVIVFSDEIPDNTTAEVWNAGAVLKDTYNAAVYTVGLWDEANGTSEDFNSYLNDLSSNLFRATPDNTNTAKGDSTQYYYNSEKKLDTLLSRFTGFNSIATSLATPYTSVALDEDNSVLRDIISDNFIVPENPTVTLQTASSSYNNDTFSWTIDQSVSSEIHSAWDDQEKTLSVTGFDYNSNYVTTEQSGKKIIVTIEGLTLKDNAQTESDRRIYSNEAGSGIYKSNVEDLLFAAFPRPYVDKTSDLVPSGTSGTPENGVVLNKYLTAKENGNYDLTLEAYSTSKNVKVTTKEKIPTDFVVVVDQSGSMDTKDIPADDPTVQNNLYLEDVANGQYYYKDGDNYYRVYGVKDYLYRYYPANYWFTGDIVEHLGADIGWFMGETDATTNIANAFYFREVVNGNTYYIPIKTTIQGKIGTYYMRFSYPSKQTGGNFEFNREETTYSSNGNSPWYKNVLNGDVMTSGGLWATANAAVQTLYPNDNAYTYSTINLLLARPRTGMYVNYPMYGRHLAYTKLCYRDESGAEHEVPSNINGRTTWEYCDDDGIARSAQAANSARPTYSGLYKYNKYIDRISALKGALNEFAEAVANEEDDFGAVDNRISIVGFSSDGYNNTELLTSTRDDFEITSGGYISADYPNNYNGVSKSAADAPGSGWYESALVNACDTDEVGAPEKGDVNDDILEAINALTPYGGTQPEDGLNMAHQILTKRSKTTYTIQSGKDKDNPVDRNTVVIYFTDGRPGNYHESNQYTEANDVVQAAHNIKGYKNTSLFSIGVFGESDGNPLTYDAKNERDSASGEIIRDIPRAQWKYLGGWMETYQTGGTYYCLRRQWRPNGADGYTETANDTIFDYMSVVSSNYPTAENYIAPEWLAGNFNGNYEDATDGVRHKDTAEATNKYYRMASSQETLIEAFMQAITMTSQEIEGDGSLGVNTILRDILNDGTFEMTGNTNVVLQTAKGKADANGVVDFDAPEDPSDDASDLHKAKGDKQVDVWGFDYSTNSIYHGKPEDNEHGLSEHQGRKLIVTLTNVVPNALKTSEGLEDPRLFSNKPESGLLNNGTTVAYFPKPAITRHSYTMDVGADNDKAQFEVTTTLVKGSGATDDLSDVILVKPDGTRVLYSTLDEEDKTFNMGNGQTFYYENVPAGYSVKTSIKAPDSFYEYTFWTNNEATKDTLSTKEQTDRTLNYSDNVLHVTSKSRYRTVTIAESVSGPYALTSDLFSVNLTLTPPDGTYTESTIALASDVTLTRNSHGQYEGSISDLPGNQNEKELRVPAGWTLKVEPVEHGKYDVESGYPKYNTNVDPTQKPIEDDGVVIDQNLTNIFINNISKEITVEGIFNSNGHNWIIYLLVGIAAVAVIGGGIFLWKKKDEFAEQ